MRRAQMELLLIQMDVSYHQLAYQLESHRLWMSSARQWRICGRRSSAAKCLQDAAGRRQAYQQARAHIARCKTEMLEACHD